MWSNDGPNQTYVSALTRLTTTAVALATAVTALLSTTMIPAVAAVPDVPVQLPVEIEPMPPYQPQQFCDPVAKPGTRALANLLTSTYAGTAIVSLTRPCDGSRSEHYDGRAIDWGVDHRIDAQRAKGKAFLHWLFSTDDSGNDDAMLRRLGVMYVIWNKQIWGAYSQRWEPYSCSGTTACHVDHMHISLDWSGAMKKTSFWTGKVTEPMDPPLYALRTVGETQTVSVEAREDDPTPEFKLVSGARYRLTVSGTYHYDGERGHRADAECSTPDGDTWSPLTADEKGPRSGALDLWINDMHRWRPDQAAADGCDATHHYHRTISIDDNTPLVARVAVDNPWWTDGALTLTIRRVA